jgi:hypothetical protein
MNKIINLSKDLASALTEKAERQIDLENIERELYKREIALTPPDGWPGKNAETRDLEKAKFLGNDETWTRLAEIRMAQRQSITLLDGTIAALEAERRGFEWEVRANLVTMLAANAINRNGHTPIDDSAFDDVPDYHVDSAATKLAFEQTFPTPDPDLEDHSTEDDLPF